jgi:DNA repair protein SbcC/Rad50
MTEYLKSLGIVNFLNHKELLVEFCPGFNVIAGDSDSGKSAVLRAISWITNNDPTGDAIKNWNAEKSESVCAEMTFEDSSTKQQISIIKERIGSTSSYSLSTLPDPLDVVGQSVPLEVQELIGFSDLNFKGQHSPYLFQLTSGQLAKKINELAGLSSIDVSLKNLNSKAITTDRECKRLAGELQQKEQEIEKMSYLEQMGLDIVEIETLEKKLKEKSDRLGLLNKIIGDISILLKEMASNESILKAVVPADKINSLISGFEEKETRKLQITSLVEVILSTSESIQIEESWLEAEKPFIEINSILVILESKQLYQRKISSLVNTILNISESLQTENALLEVEKPSSEITELIGNLGKAENRKTQVQSSIKNIENIQTQLKRTEENITNQEEELRVFLVNSKICPTCLREYDQATIERITKA